MEIADTPQKARIGLSNRTTLNQDAGMLFLTDYPRDIQMWMKDTLIPLDMLFFDEEGQIVYIHTAQPLDLTPVGADQPILGVVELFGGTCEKLNIKEGDFLRFVEPFEEK